jgi:predicted nucleotidyltransferase
MPSRFHAALEEVVTEIEAQPGVEGILFFGSALTGTAGPTSDIDLYVILAPTEERTQVLLRRYSGVEAEIHLAPAETWRRRLEEGKPVVITAFATGQALLDRTGVVAELSRRAREQMEQGPPALSPHEVDRWRYRLTDLAGDLEDVAGQPADERLLGAHLVTLALEAYCALNRLWGDKPKRLLAYVERHDPELGRLARSFFAGDLDRHLAQTIVDRVLAPHGGRIGRWESVSRHNHNEG